MDCRYEPCFTAKINLLSCQIQMNKLFKNNDRRKRDKYDRNIHKAMIIPVHIYQMNKKLFFMVHKNACKWEFADNLQLQFIDQLQSDIVIISIVTFHIYKSLLQKWKYGIGPNNIQSFNK